MAGMDSIVTDIYDLYLSQSQQNGLVMPYFNLTVSGNVYCMYGFSCGKCAFLK